jgi:hypothetical protein
LKPLTREAYGHPDAYYEDCSSFADYIGNEFEGQVRESCVEGFSKCLSDILEYQGNSTLIYKGMDGFVQDWINAIKDYANKLTEQNIMKEYYLYRLKKLVDKTHLEIESRFSIDEYDEHPNSLATLMEFLSHQKIGTKIYVGSVVDFHF